jgi:hypothetical protein
MIIISQRFRLIIDIQRVVATTHDSERGRSLRNILLSLLVRGSGALFGVLGH